MPTCKSFSKQKIGCFLLLHVAPLVSTDSFASAGDSAVSPPAGSSSCPSTLAWFHPSTTASSGTDITRLLAGNPRPESASSSSSEMHTRSNSRLVESVDRQSELSLLNPEQNLTNKFSSASVFFSRQLKEQQYAINTLTLAYKLNVDTGIHQLHS